MRRWYKLRHNPTILAALDAAAAEPAAAAAEQAAAAADTAGKEPLLLIPFLKTRAHV